MNELLREIEEDIRQERLQSLWQRVGKTLIKISLALILGTAIGVGVQHWRQKNAEERTALLLKGIERLGQGESAAEAFAPLEKEEGTTQYALAMLLRAASEERAGDHEAATKSYRAASESGGALADLGALLSAGDQDMLEEPSRDSAFYHSLAERRAWQMLAQGKRKDAAAVFAALALDAEAPASLRSRAAQAQTTLSADE